MINSIYYQLDTLATLCTFAAVLGIGLLAFLRWKSAPLRFWFAVNCGLAAFWCLNDFAGGATSSRDLYIFTLRAGSLGWLFLGPALFIFLAFFLGRENLVRTRGRRLLLLALELPFGAMFWAVPEVFFPASFSPEHGHYQSVPTLWFAPLLLSIIGWVVAQVWIISSSLRRQSDPLTHERSRLLGLILVWVVAAVVLTNVLLPALGYFSPTSGGTFLGWFFIVAFALIQRFQLLPSAQVLSAKVDQLQEFNRTLEQKVEERTRELRESGLRYREIFENVQDFIFSLDLEGRFTSANPQMERVTGVREKEVAEKSLFQVIGENYPPHLLEVWNRDWNDLQAQICAPENLYRNEVLLPTPSGEERNVIFTWSGIFREGKRTGYLGLGRDVTESKRAEDALRESETRYREIFESVQEFILALDLEGRITSANPQVKQTIGFKTDHLVGKKLAELIEEYLPPPQLEHWKKVWREIQAKVQKPGDLFREEVFMPIASGELRTFVFIYSGIFREGRLVGYLHIGRDITESVKLKKALEEYSSNLEQMVAERTKELEATYVKLTESARLAGKAEMAAGVLHNIGNAVNSIGVRLEMVRARACNCPMESVARTVEFLEQHQEHLGSFFREDPKGKQVLPFLRQVAVAAEPERAQVKEALEFVRGQLQHIAEIMAVEQNYHRPGQSAEPTDLQQIVREALSLLQDSLRRQGIRVEQDLLDLPLLSLDRSQAIQVAYNLLKNAVEALEKNPEGERRIRVQTRIAQDAAGEVEIIVEDNGIGIRPEDLPRLFQFGFTTKALRGGHGFGLHASANYIQSMGGRIEAESQGPGRGAVFRVRLPLGPDQESAADSREKEDFHQPAEFNF